MVTSVNLSNLSIDSQGRVSFGGLSSGIDLQAVVDGLIAVKRIPVDTIENRVSENEEKLAALRDFRSLLDTLKGSLTNLRGAITFQDTGNIFAAKQAYATTTRTDGQTPSAAANLIGVSVTNAAATGSHEIEVRQVATAHKVRTSTFTSQTTALGAGGLGVLSADGTITVNGVSVSVSTTDTLQDLRDRINNANTGSNATGVSASIVQISSNEFTLVMTSDATGTDLAITDTAAVLSDLGVSATNGAAAYRNGLAGSKIETGDGFVQIVFDGAQADNAFKVSYDSATKVMTLTRGDDTTETATLATADIASGATERVTFDDFGATIILDSTFNKAADITVDADVFSVTGGTAAIADPSTIKITDSAGDISGISSTTLTFGNFGTPANISVTVGAFTGNFDGSSTGAKTVTLTNGSNSLTVGFTLTGAFDGAESAADIDLQELENTVGATGATFSNQLQTPYTARITADGLVDVDRFESNLVASGSTTLGSLTSNVSYPASFGITVGADTVTVSSIASADSLSQLATDINTAITAAGGGNAVYDAGTTASVVTHDNGVRLVITNTSGAAITLTDTSSLLSDLGVDNDLVIERASNTVDDLFAGTTLSLFGAEEGTTIKIDIEQDLSNIKTVIQDFVSAYNEFRIFVNENQLVDPATGVKSDEAGVLFGDATLNEVTRRLTQTIGVGLSGEDSSLTFKVLREVGITLSDGGDDPLMADTLEIDETMLDEKLLNNPDDVRKLFAFDFTSGSALIGLLSFDGNTTYASAGYTLNLTSDGNDITGADIDGVANSATVSGNTITVISGGAKGLTLHYSGDGDSALSTSLDFTTGLATGLYFSLDTMLDEGDGIIKAAMSGIEDENEAHEDRIEDMLYRLELERDHLTDKFVKMEVALAKAATLRETISQALEALTFRD